jgi:hypothetical protein
LRGHDQFPRSSSFGPEIWVSERSGGDRLTGSCCIAAFFCGPAESGRSRHEGSATSRRLAPERGLSHVPSGRSRVQPVCCLFDVDALTPALCRARATRLPHHGAFD